MCGRWRGSSSLPIRNSWPPSAMAKLAKLWRRSWTRTPASVRPLAGLGERLTQPDGVALAAGGRKDEIGFRARLALGQDGQRRRGEHDPPLARRSGRPSSVRGEGRAVCARNPHPTSEAPRISVLRAPVSSSRRSASANVGEMPPSACSSARASRSEPASALDRNRSRTGAIASFTPLNGLPPIRPMLDAPGEHGRRGDPGPARGSRAARHARSGRGPWSSRHGRSSPASTSWTARAASALVTWLAIFDPSSSGRIWRLRFEASIAQVLARLAGLVAGPSAR